MKYYRITLRKLDKSVRVPAYIINHYATVMNMSIEAAKTDAKEMIIIEFVRTNSLEAVKAHWLSEKILQKAEAKIQELRNVVYKKKI